ncbi:c-di-GMP phosphodiesterase [Leptospira perolatii]|uniref:C-di-GMP phosphodiesterase n=1 Tax=Leptospira perolatii TaxID=2023191 RepID=A0A2M9ZRF3_9LEPT|nr:HD domain-containing phosphohydrolase [Leptospira perolatii]PJZ71124.1 c-di-GMP phosphodiesterase [Leptospira perolatii]PJZ74656.1 c-di-GMP phosphodiesterase [Leptospira perolatii]
MDASKDLQKFDFTEDVIQHFRENRIIPVDFYNKTGQILIHKKDMASGEDISKLLKFEQQGIFFLKSEISKIKPGRKGGDVSFTKLVNTELTSDMAKGASDLLLDIKKYPLNGSHVREISKSIDSILEDFKASPDMETGLVNIIEVMSTAGMPVDSEVLTKRTVVAMAMKVRAAKAFTKADLNQKKSEQVSLMMASYLADIGYTQMKIPTHGNLKTEELEYIKNHPIISYLMVANLNELDESVKSIVLNHHRPHKGEGVNNNYPQTKNLVQKLNFYKDKYKTDYKKSLLVADVQKQLKNVLINNISHEDIGIISIAGEFASLTTQQPWRPPIEALTAMKLILNNSFFAYNEKTLKDFYDHVGLSLCDNQPFIKVGDYVIVASQDSNRKVFFEICAIRESNKNSIRPMLERIGTIQPKFSNNGKIRISGFEPASLKIDRRRAIFNLDRNADPRRIIYLIDPELDPEFYESLDQKARDVFGVKTSTGDTEAVATT